MRKILYATFETVPFIKSGGLADVAFSLPKELRHLGTDVRVVLPKYSQIPERFRKKMTFLKSFEVKIGWRNQYCGIEYLEYDGIPFYFIDNEYYFKRDCGYNAHYDDGERYSFFCRAVLEMIANLDFKPDIIHCNDWHTGMISPLLKGQYRNKSQYSKIKTIFTIHNLKYQGVFPREILGELLDLDMEYFHSDALEFFGGISFLKGGIKYSDIVTTVSQTYADEIQYKYFGENLDGLIRTRKSDLYGIVNGIDYDLYNPDKDKHIFLEYNSDSLQKKLENKVGLQRILNLPERKDVPLIGMVTRLAHMKGLDLVLHILDELLEEDIQMVVLGTGEPYFESKLKEYQDRYPGKVSTQILFDESLAHKIYAASDMFVMPSKFEPCGLSQLIALRYGAIPIVRETGGLKDTVTSYNKYTGEGNGFSFANYNAHEMLYTIKRALSFYKDKERWNGIVSNAMKGDYSWRKSAEIYKVLYEKLDS
ncbi:glycogen synthase GlgA [Wukongibacter baidiensis]|uniref:glycogen synthase GlgA n=1 Tax=Wukongibacter baidiensis TaxID=1723361 RepID=UPI003D7F6596